MIAPTGVDTVAISTCLLLVDLYRMKKDWKSTTEEYKIWPPRCPAQSRRALSTRSRVKLCQAGPPSLSRLNFSPNCFSRYSNCPPLSLVIDTTPAPSGQQLPASGISLNILASEDGTFQHVLMLGSEQGRWSILDGRCPDTPSSVFSLVGRDNEL
jgi:hypothetical protein